MFTFDAIATFARSPKQRNSENRLNRQGFKYRPHSFGSLFRLQNRNERPLIVSIDVSFGASKWALWSPFIGMTKQLTPGTLTTPWHYVVERTLIKCICHRRHRRNCEGRVVRMERCCVFQWRWTFPRQPQDRVVGKRKYQFIMIGLSFDLSEPKFTTICSRSRNTPNEKYQKQRFWDDFILVCLFSSVPRSWEPV